MAAIAMIRMNHKGTRMDAENFYTNGPGNVNEVVSYVKQVKGDGLDEAIENLNLALA